MPLFKKLMNSLRYSIEGMIAIWKKELSFRLEMYTCLIVIPITFFLSRDKVEKLILILLLLLLLAVELINSAIEALVDRISSEIHPLSKIAKDACSAAVSIIILMNIIAWLIVSFSP